MNNKKAKGIRIASITLIILAIFLPLILDFALVTVGIIAGLSTDSGSGRYLNFVFVLPIIFLIVGSILFVRSRSPKYQRTSEMAIVSFLMSTSSLFSLLTCIFFGILVSILTENGHQVGAIQSLFVPYIGIYGILGFILSISSIVAISVKRKQLKGYSWAILALLLNPLNPVFLFGILLFIGIIGKLF